MRKAVTFGGITAEPGTKKSGWAPVLDTDYRLPVTVINGVDNGKTILLTSSIHGCEYPSIEAVFRVAETLDPKEVSGAIVVINPVNVDGFLTRTPYLVPQDGKNLNLLEIQKERWGIKLLMY
ncbi:MAG: succinylglutamate desuccinylase/aspartoacylase family protein [Lachnospiraceae bacterium]|nr:succinylglutamate desuccinylase/aspartoacylase family protein [Lachnospiraceae bacterium]